MLVAAAGTLAGSYVGSLLQGDPPPLEQRPEIDMMPVYEMLNQAGQQINNAQNLSAGAYQRAMDTATSQVKQAYALANSKLQPMSDAGNAAYNEYLRMIGQDPIQATAGLSTRVGSVGFAGDTSGLQSLFDQATLEKDPSKRAELKQQVLTALNNQSILDERQKDKEALGQPQLQNYRDPLYHYVIEDNKKSDRYGQTVKKVDKEATQQLAQITNQMNQQTMNEYSMALAKIDREWDQKAADATEAKNTLINDFTNKYTDKYDAAYTQDQINRKVTQTVGYQNALKSGTQAVGRLAAAAGGLMSGNTLLATQKYGQDLATGTYQNTLSNLLSTASVGQSATEAMSQNDLSMGGYLSQLTQQAGAYEAQSYTNQGQAMSDILKQMAATNLQVQKMNIDYYYTDKKMKADAQAASQAAAMAGAVAGSNSKKNAASQAGKAAGASGGGAV